MRFTAAAAAAADAAADADAAGVGQSIKRLHASTCTVDFS